MEISQINHLIEEKKRKRNRPMIQSLLSILYAYRRFKSELAEYKEKKIEYSVNPTEMQKLGLRARFQGLETSLFRLKMTVDQDLMLLRGFGTFNGEKVKIVEPDQYIPVWEDLINELDLEEKELEKIKTYKSETELLREENAFLKMKIQGLEVKNG